MAVAGAKVGNLFRRAPIHGGLESRRHDGRVAHPGVDAPQIAARPPGPGIVRRQLIEQLGLDVAIHFKDEPEDEDDYPTSSSAPWQLKPAPNDDIHHNPSGTASCKARWSTKKTVGLLILPYSRSTAAL